MLDIYLIQRGQHLLYCLASQIKAMAGHFEGVTLNITFANPHCRGEMDN